MDICGGFGHLDAISNRSLDDVLRVWSAVTCFSQAHFGIIFLSVFVTFVFMAMGFFGRTVPGAVLTFP